MLTASLENDARPGLLQGRHRRRRRAGRLRVPVGARPQRRRVPGANTYLPYPGKRPYPNPLDKDADDDHDGDSLTLLRGVPALGPLRRQAGRRPARRRLPPLLLRRRAVLAERPRRPARAAARPSQPAASYPKGTTSWTGPTANGYDPVLVSNDRPRTGTTRQRLQSYDIRDVNRNGAVDGTSDARLRSPEDLLRHRRRRLHLRRRARRGRRRPHQLRRDSRPHDPRVLEGCYDEGDAVHDRPTPAWTSTDPDTDGDGVRDGADDRTTTTSRT